MKKSLLTVGVTLSLMVAWGIGRVQGQQGESTRVRFEWENGPDEQTRTHVEASLKAQSGSPTVAQK